MVGRRWLNGIGPGVIALGAAGLICLAAGGSIAATTIGRQGERPLAFASCAGRPVITRPPMGDADDAWFDLEPVLDGAGALVGQRLTIGSLSGPDDATVDLPAESFAAGPFGSSVLVGADDGGRSRLDLLDIGSGCRWSLDSSTTIIRTATIDRTRGAVIELRLARSDRADLGIWARPVGADGGLRRILGPIEPDGRFGQTWSTGFGWDLAGGRLAIQSCGEAACRTRIMDRDDGTSTLLDRPDLGLLVGLDGDRLVTYGACRGLPCPLISTDAVSGAQTVLAEQAGSAVLVGQPGAGRLVSEVATGAEHRLRSVSLFGGPTTDLGSIPWDVHLAATPGRPDAVAHPGADAILLVLDDPATGVPSRPTTRHIEDGTSVLHDEVAP